MWEILTAEQRAAYRALPPRLNAGDRGRAPWEVLRAMHLRPEQYRHAGHRLFLEVLAPGQVAAWIVAPTVKP